MYNQSIELRHLRYFVAVAQELHFSRAAAKLQIAQPPLSQQIRQLEQIVGARLFERNHHSVALTNAGHVFLKEVVPILEQIEDALIHTQRAHQGLMGELAIGYVRNAPGADMFLPEVVARYRQRFPAVEVSLHEMSRQQQHAALQTQHIQIGYTVNHEMAPEFAAAVVQQLPIVVVCAPDHRLAAQPTIMLRDLAHEPFVSGTRQVAGAFYDRIIQLCGFSPQIVQEVSDIPMVLGLVAAHVGIALFPVSMMLQHHPGVVFRYLADSDVALTFETHLIWRKQETSPLVPAFLATAREIQSKYLPGDIGV